ncbi:MAG: hypothetical protein AAB562_02060 [Patescibacteria group bacterium]
MERDLFRAVFLRNLHSQSRSAKGVSDTSVSATKKPLLITGEALAAKVRENTELLAEFVWQRGNSDHRRHPKVTFMHTPDAVMLGEVANQCNDIVNDGLQDLAVYDDARKGVERASWRACHAMVAPNDGLFDVNRRFRVWQPKYADPAIALHEIGAAMKLFDCVLAARMVLACDAGTWEAAAEALAYADHMMDGRIHPWADGNARTTTALIMYLALALFLRKEHERLPVFRDRKTHLSTIEDLPAHTDYYKSIMTPVAEIKSEMLVL